MKLNKTIYTAAALSVLFGAASCSDSYLDEKIYSSYTPESVEDVNGKLLGLHKRVANILGVSGWQGYWGIWQDGTDVGAPGDIQGVERPFFQYGELDSENPGVGFLWQKLYQIVAGANLIINNQEQGTDAQRAEARFFRAWAYDQLVTGWGDVPLITEEVTSPRTDYTRTPKAEVDKVIDEDLQFAMKYLPDVNGLVKEARISKGAACILAGQAYNRMGYQYNNAEYYKKAEQACSDIIGSGQYKLIEERYGKFTLEPGDFYADMFRYGNQRRSQGNTEGVWTLEMENNANVPNGTVDNPQHRRNWVAAFHKLDGMQNADSIGGRGNGRLRLSNYVKYGIYDDDDIRNSNYNIRRVMWYNRQGWDGATYYLDKDGYRVEGDNPDSPDVVRTVNVTVGSRVYCHKSDTLNVFYPHTTKWGGYDPNDDFGYALVKDFPMMRFAEAYLLRAEARIRQGNAQGAAEDINVLRDRAYKMSRIAKGNPDLGKVTAAQMNIDFLLDERIRELVGEENRRFTLMRTGELTNRVNMMVTKWAENEPTKQITGYDPNKHTLLPIPLNNIQLNKDAELTQNPGY